MCRLFIIVCLGCLANVLNAQKVDVHIEADGVYFCENGDSILKYQTAEKSINGNYTRSNYIHPLYTLDGLPLTEDFPSDHLHHRGIFWAWHQIFIGDKRIGDGWEIKDFHWEVLAVKELEQSNGVKEIQVEVVWKSNQWINTAGKEQPIVKEFTKIKVYPADSIIRKIDIEISICALEKNMRIGGAENEKGYGGFSPRIRLVDDIVFTGSEGTIIPDNLPVQVGAWLDITGSLGKNGALGGLTVLSHSKNPGFPNPWILRVKRSMQNAVFPFPGANAIPFSETDPIILRYRLIVHKGNIEGLNIATLYSDYTNQ